MRAQVAVATVVVLLGAAAAVAAFLRDATAQAPGLEAAAPARASRPADGFERVVRRTVRFRGAAAARTYAALAVSEPGTALGEVGARQTLAGGVLLTAAPCGCHRQVPQYLFVVARGSEVAWLSAAGPRMTPARVLQLASAG